MSRANRRWLNEGGRRLSRKRRLKKNARNRTQPNDSQSRRSKNRNSCSGKYSGIVALYGGKEEEVRWERERQVAGVWMTGWFGRWLILHTLYFIFCTKVCRAFSFLYCVHYNELVSFRCIFEVIRVVYLLPIPPSSSLSLVSTSRINSCFVTKQHPHFCCLVRG